LKSERLTVKSKKLTFYKALIGSKMTYACPAWEFAADSHLLNCSSCKIRVLRTTGNLPRCTPTRALSLTFQIPYLYDYITKVFRKQAQTVQNHDNANVQNVGKSEAQHRKYERLKLGGGQASELP
jgi:hypothetical protein